VRERFGLATRRVRAPGFATVLAARAGAGVAAGLLVLGAVTRLGPDPPFSALAAAALTLLAVALLPRAGWLLAAAGVCGWLASPEAGREGTALVLVLALAPTPFPLPRSGLLWSLPALAPLLGTVALAPAYVGVAGLASTAWRRAGLACSGFIWLVVAELLTGRNLLFGVPDGALPRGDWEASVTSAASDALGPPLGSPALAPLVVWGAFAAVLPLVVRGRFLAFDLVGAGVWAAGLAVAHAGLGDLLASTTTLGQARGAIAGVVLAAVVAVAATSVASPVVAAHAEPATATEELPCAP